MDYNIENQEVLYNGREGRNIKLKKLVREFFGGREFWVNLSDLYSYGNTLLEEDNSEKRQMIRAAILSKSILEYDFSSFEELRESANLTYYRPYLLNFYIDVSLIETDIKTIIRSMENTVFECDGWYCARLCSPSENNLDGYIFNGYFEYGTSPIKREGKRLCVQNRAISRRELDKINKTYDLKKINACIRSRQEIDILLNNIFGNTVFDKARIYNLGHGNCNYLYGHENQEEKRLLYDIGYPRIKDPQKDYSSVFRRIGLLRPHCVVISHWDEDHFKGCVYGTDDKFHCPWIAPEIKDGEKKNKINALRIMSYLMCIGKLHLVERNCFGKVASIGASRLNLWIGDGKDPRISKINCEGLFLENISQDVKTIFAGDVPYKAMPDSVCIKYLKDVDYLIVPHHGSKMDYSVIQALMCKNRLAIVPNISKTKMDIGHICELINKCTYICATGEFDDGIDFNLHKRFCVNKNI